jgi:hypothetical protein
MKKHLKSDKKLFLQIILILATSYNNIGLVYKKIGEHSKEVLYCEQALKVVERSLPPNHPDIQLKV